MKICSVSVGRDFCEKYSQRVKQFAPKNIDLIILTDYPEYFDFCNTILYTEDVFSYFSKNTLISNIAEKYKSDVLYIDIDSFHIVDIKKINSHNFLYNKLWVDYPYSKLNELPQAILDFYKINGNIEIENMNEYVFYLPYSNKVKKLKQDLIEIKKIWDNETKNSEPKGNAKKYSKFGIGWGEGIPLSLALKMNNIQMQKYSFTKQKLI